MPGKINRTKVLHKSRGFHTKHIAPRLSKSAITQKSSTSCLLKQSSVCFLKPRQNPSFKIVSSNHVTKCRRNKQNKKITEANKSAQAKATTHHHPKAAKPSFANTKHVRDVSDKRVLEEVSQDGSVSFPSGLSRLSTIASIIRAHSKQYKSFDQSEDTLVIGGDLLISKATDFSSESLYSYNLIQADIKAKLDKQTSVSRDSVTIERISYKCEVLREHSAECPCSTPRLHVYLTANHRCSNTCSLGLGTRSSAQQGGLTTTTNRGDSSKLTWSRHLLPLNMSGRIRSKTKSRSTPLISEFSGNLHCDWLSSPKMTNTVRLEEPESELLMEDEGESLPTIMHTLSGGVEYIVLDDETLNLTKDVSPDALKNKIDTILEDIDEKPDARETKESRGNNSGVDKKEPDSNSTAPLKDFTHVSDVIKKEEEIDIKTEPLAGCSSLAVACTNHSPSIKDIFGDVSIKEEPLEMGSNNDMSVDDFSKEINKISKEDQTTIVSDPKEGKSKSEYDEEWNNGLFARLIKEETNMDDDVDIDTHGSDDSLGPLQIDESEPVYGNDDVQPRDVTTNGQMPIVNIISPFKIKILLGSTKQDALQLAPSDPIGNLADASGSVKAVGKAGKKNGTVGARKGRKSPKKATVNKNLDPKTPVAIENSGASAIKSFKCFYCQVESPNVQALAKHFDDHQKDGLIICYFCQKSFGDKTGLKRHMRTHTGEKPYQCKICGKRFSLPGNFKKHRDIHEDRRTEPCEVCGKTFRRKEHLKYHMRTHTGEKPYTCSECGTSFTARYSLQIHMNIHLGKKPYKCTFCSKAFSDKSTMRKHVRVHTGEKPFTCELCGRCFGESGTLAAHMATHRSERPFKCDKCHLSFKTSGGLRQHEKIHTGEKQFACRFCGMKFLMKYNMTMHERIHTGEKPYTCNHCDRSFRSRSCLAKHVVLHGGEEERRYHCDHCSSKFYRKAHLRRHIDMHLGIKNYECEKCKKKFCTKGTLRSHLKTFHSNGARRFPCNECGRVFKRKIYVTTHVCLKYPVIKNETAEGSSEASSVAHPSTLASDSDQSSFEIVKSELEDEFMEDDEDDDSDDLDDLDDEEEDDEDEEFEDEEEIEERGLATEIGDL